MKTHQNRTIIKKHTAIAGLFFSIGLLPGCSMVESVTTVAKNKNTIRKEREIKINPDVFRRLMHVKNKEAQIDFFVFDLAGTMMIHYKMKEKDHKDVSGLKRGSYVYQVFKGDEMCESGKLNIK